jgi:general secretion pathway protein B
MSIILDALRKSERDRQLGAAPTIEPLPLVPPPPARRVWPWLAAAAIAANVGALAAVVAMWPPGERTAPAPPAAAPAPVDPAARQQPDPPAAAKSEPLRPSPAVAAPPALQPTPRAEPPPMAPVERPRAVEVPARPPRPAPDPEAPAKPRASAPAPERPIAAVPAKPAPEATEAPPASGPLRPLPYLQDLPRSLRAGVPALQIQVHVFDPDPRRAFVLTNLGKVYAGDRLADGLTLEEVTRSGAVLSWRGTRFQVGSRHPFD